MLGCTQVLCFLCTTLDSTQEEEEDVDTKKVARRLSVIWCRVYTGLAAAETITRVAKMWVIPLPRRGRFVFASFKKPTSFLQKTSLDESQLFPPP